jgi:hypothetical protein
MHYVLMRTLLYLLQQICCTDIKCSTNADCLELLCDLNTKRCVEPGLFVNLRRIPPMATVPLVVQVRLAGINGLLPSNVSLCEATATQPGTCKTLLLQLFDDGSPIHADAFPRDGIFANRFNIDGTTVAAAVGGCLYLTVIADVGDTSLPAFSTVLTAVNPSTALKQLNDSYQELLAVQVSLDAAVDTGTPTWEALEAAKALLASKPWVDVNTIKLTVQAVYFETTAGLHFAVRISTRLPVAGSSGIIGERFGERPDAGQQLGLRHLHSQRQQPPPGCPPGTTRGKVLILDKIYDEFKAWPTGPIDTGSSAMAKAFSDAGYLVSHRRVLTVNDLRGWDQYAAVVFTTHGASDYESTWLEVWHHPPNAPGGAKAEMEESLKQNFLAFLQGDLAWSLTRFSWFTGKNEHLPTLLVRDSFFSDPNNMENMDGTIVILNACSSSASWSFESTLLGRGAGAVLGWTDTVAVVDERDNALQLIDGLLQGSAVQFLPGIGDTYTTFDYYTKQTHIAERTLGTKDPWTRLCKCRCGNVCCEGEGRACVNNRCRCASGRNERMCGNKCGCPKGQQCDRAAVPGYEKGVCVPCKGLTCTDECCQGVAANFLYCKEWNKCGVCPQAMCEGITIGRDSEMQPWRECCPEGTDCPPGPTKWQWLAPGQYEWVETPCCAKSDQCGDLCCTDKAHTFGKTPWTCVNKEAVSYYDEISKDPALSRRRGFCCASPKHEGCVASGVNRLCCDTEHSYCALPHLEVVRCSSSGGSDCVMEFPLCCSIGWEQCGGSCYDPKREKCSDYKYSVVCNREQELRIVDDGMYCCGVGCTQLDSCCAFKLKVYEWPSKACPTFKPCG